MSHTPHETIICPNCGSKAEKNYCSECGQETHLHNDTFFGLIGHFIGHYFHYDSKFWQTLRALWFSPGKLTIAYWNKQRMRYIPPISLYIFVSAVFFICLSFSVKYATDDTSAADKKAVQEKMDEARMNVRPAQQIAGIDSAKDSTVMRHNVSLKRKKISLWLTSTGNKLDALGSDPDSNKEIINELVHTFSKVFFFLIPMLAFMLWILFFRRREILFVQHAIFSLHFHAFCFSLLLPTFLPFLGEWFFYLVVGIAFLYLILSLRKVYQVKWFKSVVYSVLLFVGYSFWLLVGLFISLLIQFGYNG